MSIKAFFQTEWVQIEAAWQTWGDAVRAQGAQATEWIVGLSAAAAGDRILDLASGVGEPALELSRRVGPRGQVVASDLVAGPLCFIERSATRQGLPWLTTQVADMECLPFADASFDRVTCRFGLMFCPEPERALKEALRVVRPGGRIALLTWGDRRQPLFESTLGALNAGGADDVTQAERSPVPLDERPGPFQFALPERLASALARAGFEQVHAEQRRLAWPFAGTAQQYWRMFGELAGPSFVRRLGELGQREVTARALNALNAYRQGQIIDPGAVVVGGTGVRPS
jgi:SAM-dependent methyltransferase